MLQIEVPLTNEGWDEEKQEFIEPKTQTLNLEHSLVSISKWESKWCRSFLSKSEMTVEETLHYIQCMTLNKNVDPEVYNHISMSNIEEIKKYIAAPMTATYFNEPERKGQSRDVITSELIYYWMITLNIPVEFEKWHLNRLLTLIQVCNIKNQPPKKMGKSELASRNRALNAARRQQLNSKG